MSAPARLMWNSADEAADPQSSYLFFYDPVGGLRDVDFHEIQDDGWKYLSCPDGKTPAVLVVSPTARFEDIRRCLDTLATKGKFKSVQIKIEKQ